MNLVAGKERREKSIVTGNLLCNNNLNIKDLNCFNNTWFRGKSSQLIVRANDAGPKKIWMFTFVTLEKEKRKLCRPDADYARFDWKNFEDCQQLGNDNRTLEMKKNYELQLMKITAWNFEALSLLIVKEEHSIQKQFIGYWIFQLGNEIKLWIAIHENHRAWIFQALVWQIGERKLNTQNISWNC